MVDWLCSRERAVEHAIEIAKHLLSHGSRVLLVLEGVEYVLTEEEIADQVAH